MTAISIKESLGKRTLIMGEVGSGKTQLTDRLLEEALSLGLRDITVIDMAPKAVKFRGLSVGGTLKSIKNSKVRYLRVENLKTPRLSAKDADELVEYAEYNRKITEGLFDNFIVNPTSMLFVNDVSIYLQRGKIDRLWRAFKAAETVIVNGYYGEKLKNDYGTGLSSREKTLMEELASRMDVVIRT